MSRKPNLLFVPKFVFRMIRDTKHYSPFCELPLKGVARIWFRGGPHPFRGGGGPDPLFFASDPKSQGSPLTYFWLPPDFGGGGRAPRPPPGYALAPTSLDFRFGSWVF